MAERLRIWLIINPISGTRHGEDIGLLARNTLDSSRFDLTLRYTERKGHGAEIAREAVAAGVDIVAAVGGDGTINEVASQLVGSRTALAIIPHGSGNGLAYHLQIPINVRKALAVINDLRIEKMDVGYVNGKPFFSIAGIGFDAKVAYDFEADPRRGFFTYFKHILHNYFQYQSCDYRITYDGQTIDTQAFFITFANSSQWGYEAKIAPKASVQDGLMDICMMSPQAWLGAPGMALRLFTGSLDGSLFMDTFRAKDVMLRRETESPFHIDGDPVKMEKDIRIRIIPEGLHVLVEKRF